MFKLTPSRCTECQICMQVCAWEHFAQNNPKRSRVRIEAEWPEAPCVRVCLACSDHECVGACPTGALSWDGWVQLREDLCDACGRCVEACPVQGIAVDAVTRLPLVCDTCQGAFLCARWCPTRAIQRLGP
jgi:Fe-S-cluster-containing hydrogenase component 2